MNIWHFDLLQEFNKQYYKDLITATHRAGDEIFLCQGKDANGEDIEYNEFCFPFKKRNTNYLLPAEAIEGLPIEITKKEKMSYKGKAYSRIIGANPCGFKPHQHYSPRGMINKLCDYEHTANGKDFTIHKIMCLMAYYRRINVRVASKPAFCKGSIINVLSLLMGNVGLVQAPSIANIIWMLKNRIVVTDEVSSVEEKDVMDLQKYFFQAADFSPTYTKPTRATLAGSDEVYDMKDVSNMAFYNLLENTRRPDKYFDFRFDDGITERMMPFKFTGNVLDDFTEPTQVHKLVKENWDEYDKMIRTILYYMDYQNFEKELHGYKENNFQFKDRYLRNWKTICLGIDLWAKSQEEYDMMVNTLYNRHIEYLEMVDGAKGNKTLAHSFHTKVNEEMPKVTEEVIYEEMDDNKRKENIIKMIKQYPGGEMPIEKITIVYKENLIVELKNSGDLFESKPGFVRVLE